MKWLITVDSSANLQKVYQELSALGCAFDEGRQPIPLGGDEQVIQLEGPEDLPSRVEELTAIRKVSPNSELTLY